MIRPVELAGIKAGAVDLAFRRWERPRVVVGTRMRTAVGLIEVTSVEPVDEAAITEDDARRAGAASLDALRRGLAARADRPVFRVGLRWGGEDPRIALRQRPPTDGELAQIRARLDRLRGAPSRGLGTTPRRPSDRGPGRRWRSLTARPGSVRRVCGPSSPATRRRSSATS